MISLPADVVAIGFGGNVGDVKRSFEVAREALAVLGPVRSAPLYRTDPIGPAQDAFLNSVVRLQTDAQPMELLSTLQEIERLLGRDRRREERWGPRTIDLDLLIWGTRELQTLELVLPHPRMTDRRFVLVPLRELFGDDLIVRGRSIVDWLREIPEGGVDEIATSW